MSLAVRIFKFFAFAVVSLAVWNYGIGRFFEFEIVFDFQPPQRSSSLKRQKTAAGKKGRNYYKIAKLDRNSTEVSEIGMGLKMLHTW